MRTERRYVGVVTTSERRPDKIHALDEHGQRSCCGIPRRSMIGVAPLARRALDSEALCRAAPCRLVFEAERARRCAEEHPSL